MSLDKIFHPYWEYAHEWELLPEAPLEDLGMEVVSSSEDQVILEEERREVARQWPLLSRHSFLFPHQALKREDNGEKVSILNNLCSLSLKQRAMAWEAYQDRKFGNNG